MEGDICISLTAPFLLCKLSFRSAEEIPKELSKVSTPPTAFPFKTCPSSMGPAKSADEETEVEVASCLTLRL